MSVKSCKSVMFQSPFVTNMEHASWDLFGEFLISFKLNQAPIVVWQWPVVGTGN